MDGVMLHNMGGRNGVPKIALVATAREKHMYDTFRVTNLAPSDAGTLSTLYLSFINRGKGDPFVHLDYTKMRFGLSTKAPNGLA